MKLHTRCAAALLCLTVTPALAVEDGQYADFNGVKIHYIDRGKGEPIVLLHGGTSSLESWVGTGVVANFRRIFGSSLSTPAAPARATSRATRKPMGGSRRSTSRACSTR